ncbi:MAG TPA: TetR/AcrR family transcriptional regulator [Symbiobacteriaceae bacterium]|nr:TetR/AcrR family transcriptional regulator [Symbiobacteriaceae bacterium]
MPRTKEQNEQIKEERRREIIDAAIPLFARYGFATTNISQIAEAAGVSYGTVFLYFPSKEDLFRIAVLARLDEASNLFWPPAAEGESPLDHLLRLIRLQIGLFLTEACFLRLVQQILAHPEQFPDLTERVHAFRTATVEHLIPIIEKGQASGQLQPSSPRLLASLYFSHLIGIALTMAPPSGQGPQALTVTEPISQLVLRLFAPVAPPDDRTGTP